MIDRPGFDGWVGRNNANEDVEVRGGEGVNPAVCCDTIGGQGSARTLEKNTGEYTWAVQQLGDSVRNDLLRTNTPPVTDRLHWNLMLKLS